MPSPIEIAWLIPLMPLAGSTLVGILLISFNKTMNRLSKPVSLLLISCIGISTIFSYALLNQHISGAIGNDQIINYSNSLTNLKLQIGLLLDKSSALSLSITCTIGLIFLILSHQFISRKKGYVRLFIWLGMFNSAIFGLESSLNLFEIGFFWIILIPLSYLIREFWYNKQEERKIDSRRILILDLVGTSLFIAGISTVAFLTGSIEFDAAGHKLIGLIDASNISTLNIIISCLLIVLGAGIRSSELIFEVFGENNSDSKPPIAAIIHSILITSICIFSLARLSLILMPLKIAIINSGLYPGSS